MPALTGCPINGTWTLTVRDNIGIDDGFICEWGIYFNSSLHPNSEIYSPSIAGDYWHSDSTIVSDLDTAILVTPTNLGANFYTFVVEDEYGGPPNAPSSDVYMTSGGYAEVESEQPDLIFMPESLFVLPECFEDGILEEALQCIDDVDILYVSSDLH